MSENVTHIIPYDGREHGHQRRIALCNRFVDPASDCKDKTPTCPDCLRIDQEDEVELQKLRQDIEEDPRGKKHEG